jgi:hypothetical protein
LRAAEPRARWEFDRRPPPTLFPEFHPARQDESLATAPRGGMKRRRYSTGYPHGR